MPRIRSALVAGLGVLCTLMAGCGGGEQQAAGAKEVAQAPAKGAAVSTDDSGWGSNSGEDDNGSADDGAADESQDSGDGADSAGGDNAGADADPAEGDSEAEGNVDSADAEADGGDSEPDSGDDSSSDA